MLLHGRPVGASVAIVGAGGIGFDVAEFLSHDAVACRDEPGHSGVHARVGHRHDASNRAAGSCRRTATRHPPREIWLLQRKPTPPGRDLGKTTGWVHRLALKRRGVRMLAGVAYERIDDRGLAITDGGGIARAARSITSSSAPARSRDCELARRHRGRGRQGAPDRRLETRDRARREARDRRGLTPGGCVVNFPDGGVAAARPARRCRAGRSLARAAERAGAAARGARAAGRAGRDRRAARHSPAHGRTVRDAAPALDRAYGRPLPAGECRRRAMSAGADQVSGDRAGATRCGESTRPARRASASRDIRSCSRAAGRPALLRHALQRFTMREAHATLAPWLARLSAASRTCAIGRIQIRRQRTRWGSCSRSRHDQPERLPAVPAAGGRQLPPDPRARAHQAHESFAPILAPGRTVSSRAGANSMRR